MDEKEERIFIRKGTARELCKFIYRDGCAGEMHCCSCTISIPRSEAIKKMAKAIICRAYEYYLHEDTDPLTSSASAVAYAEAALNALLEDK